MYTQEYSQLGNVNQSTLSWSHSVRVFWAERVKLFFNNLTGNYPRRKEKVTHDKLYYLIFQEEMKIYS